jgi:signal transduction histidine kinase
MNEGSALSLKTIKTWLSSPQVIGFPLIIFTLIWPVATGFLGVETPGQEFAFSIHLYDLLTASTASATLLIASAVFSFTSKANKRTHIWPQLASIITAAVLAALIPIFIVETFSYVPEAYVQAIPSGIVTTLTNMLIFIIFWNSRKEQREAVREFAIARKSLNYLRSNLQTELAENLKSLQDQVMKVLEPAITQLTAELKSGSENAVIAASLRASIDQVVRPLSQELVKVETDGSEQTLQSLRQFEKSIVKLPARERWSHKLQLSEASNVPLIVLAQIAFIIPSSTFLFGVQGFLASLVASIVVVLANYMAVKLFSNLTARYKRVLALSGVLSLISAFVYFAITFAVAQQSTADLVLFVAVAVLIANFISGYITCQLAIRRVSLQLAAESNNKLQAVVTQLKQDVWLNRRRMARVVHGSIQANLQAAAIRLIRGNKDGQVKPDVLVDAVAQSLQEVLSDQVAQPMLSSGLKSLQEFWVGACELTVSVDAELLQKIDANRQAAECVYELISEATSNAVKHAAADEVDVVITASESLIEVEVRNALWEQGSDGGRNPAGFGSRIYDEITSAWSLTFDGSDAILKATLPLSR